MALAIRIGGITIAGNRRGASGPNWTDPSQPLGGETPNFWIKENSRSGLTLIDSLGHNASLLPSCGLCDANNYLVRTEANFAASVTSGYITWRGYYDGGAGTLRIFGSGDEAVATAFFTVYIAGGKPVIYARNGGFISQCITTDAISTGWHIIKFESASSHFRMTIDGTVLTVGSGLSMQTGSDDGHWIGYVPDRDNISVGCLKINSLAGSTGAFYTDYIDFNGTNKWYFSGAGNYEYDVIGSIHLAWTGTSHIYYGNNVSNQFLDVGYSLYHQEMPNTGYEYVPYVSANTPFDNIALMQSVGRIFVSHVGGDAGNYNIAPALIEFPSAITDYDRSDTTIHKAAARAGSDYNAAAPFRWRGIDICNPDIYYSWKNTGYEAKQFTKIAFKLAEPVKAYEFISYASNKNASDKLKIEGYCDIDDYYDVNIIIIGDKTAGLSEANNIVCNAIYATQNPGCIIGTGDYDDDTHTTTQLMVGLENVIKFAAPGNHDDWVYGTRTEFNANFRNGAAAAHHGAYRKISLPSIDVFLYDEWLKMDESGFYADQAATLAINLATRQASTQGQWLINGLAASTKKFKIVLFHEPAWASYATADQRAIGVVENPAMRWDWYDLGADLILSGHLHFYERLLKDTGSGSIPVIICGTAGAAQLEWDDANIDADSVTRANGFRDANFSAGMLIKMNITRDKLQIDLSGIDTNSVIHAGKDQLVITK